MTFAIGQKVIAVGPSGHSRLGQVGRVVNGRVYEGGTCVMFSDEVGAYWFHLSNLAPYIDDCVESVRAKMLERSVEGMAKYGCTVADSKESQAAFLRHAQAESMDLAVYLERCIRDLENGK
jgi:hypothetical protein